MIALPCPACGETSEHAEAYAGCMRPCPRCGAKVAVPEDPKRTVQAVPLDAVCVCGARQADASAGTWCAIRFVERDSAMPPWLAWAGFLVLPMIGMFGKAKKLGMQAAENPSRTETDMRWVCPACRGLVSRVRFWSTWGKWTLVAAAVVLAILAFARPSAADADTIPTWGIAAMEALGAYVAYRLGFLALCWRLARSYRGLKDVTPRADLRSPVFLHPDGRYEGGKT